MGVNQNIILNQRGNVMIILGLIILISIVGVGVYHFGANKNQKIPQLTPTIKVSSPTPTIQPGANEYSPNELNSFPVYPQASFLNKEKQPPCEGEVSGFSTCGSTTYTWQTKDDYDQVSSWYREDKSNTDWKCSGGAGSYDGPRSASGKTTCRKDSLVYDLSFFADSAKTEITLQIPYR